MAKVQSHEPGSFCWIELGTTDQNAAKQFYSCVFGWSFSDSPMGTDEVYTTFSLDEGKVGGCYRLPPDMTSHGVPPHWLLYIASTDVDETANRAQEAGGTMLCPPFDIRDFGRLVNLRDPAGATFAVWQARQHPGFGVEGEPGTLCWADLNAPDQARSAAFYGKVFGWQTDSKEGSDYAHIRNGDKLIGGMPPKEHQPPGAPPHWMLYFYAPDCDAYTSKATAAGGRVLMPPTTMEGVGRWSIVSDPQGAVFSLFQPEG